MDFSSLENNREVKSAKEYEKIKQDYQIRLQEVPPSSHSHVGQHSILMMPTCPVQSAADIERMAPNLKAMAQYQDIKGRLTGDLTHTSSTENLHIQRGSESALDVK